MDPIRQKLFNFIERDMIGPTLRNGGDLNEVLINDGPGSKYFSGALFPKKTDKESTDERNSSIQNEGDGANEQKPASNDLPINKESKKDNDYAQHQAEIGALSDDEEEYLNLSNACKQSALSLTIILRPTDTIEAFVCYGQYDRITEKYIDKTGKEKERVKYPRKSFDNVSPFDGPLAETDLFSKAVNHEAEYPIAYTKDGKKSLVLHCYLRSVIGDMHLYTFSLVNELESTSKSDKYFDDRETFFQVELRLENPNGFHPIPLSQKTSFPDEDAESNKLLYREVKEYAVGHGCSPEWNDRTENGVLKPVTTIRSSFMPKYELKAIVPSKIKNCDFDMLRMADDDDFCSFSIVQANNLCNEYERWISECEMAVQAMDIPEKMKVFAKTVNLKRCRECLQRMRTGISILQTNPTARRAFRLMNEAMLTQQLRSKIDVRDLIIEKRGFHSDGIKPKDESFVEPIYNDKSTWPKKFQNYDGSWWIGHWRAFQFGFVLLNLNSIVNPTSEDRENVELIWFPTGGGKTEAYLGLSAFTIFWKRLKKTDHGLCTQIFMRYTLRMLTSQQFERASALICACEHIRRTNPTDFGTAPITIGLFVGSGTTPNTNDQAKKELQYMTSKANSEYIPNPFLLTKCPWCGCQMGPNKAPGSHGPFGYHHDRQKGFYFDCENPNCEFNHNHGKMPLSVIDDYLYDNPPTLLIGTVDKFAMIPFMKPKARKLFGLGDGPVVGREHPELIIQDELHLISGPLGSMVGAYETMFDALCSYEEDGSKHHKPKIIASTATISQARMQCKNIFDVNEDNVKIFPPSGIDAGKTFFSEIDENKNGRVYVGIYMPGASSNQFGEVHLLSSLYAARDPLTDGHVDFGGNIDQEDAYHTNVCYFNSLKELGQSATWVSADIPEYIKTHFDHPYSPYLNYLELTSRTSDGNLSSQFKKLETKCSDKKCVDVCLATNMISVGIDISRLGLMTVFGQPKTTSEYIQASSRVGRDSGRRPGMVFTVYNPSKPRDKSIFESFEIYHSQFYSFVEPTSVSPFAPPLRQIAIPAIYIGIARFLNKAISDVGGENLQTILSNTGDLAKKIILERVARIDREELKDTERQIDDMVNGSWKKYNVVRVSYPMINSNVLKTADPDMPCAIYPADYFLPDSWEKVSYGVPTSMRSVDKDCVLNFIDDYTI